MSLCPKHLAALDADGRCPSCAKTTHVKAAKRNTSIGTVPTLYVGDSTLASEALRNPRAARAVREWLEADNDGVTPNDVRPDATQVRPWWVCEDPKHIEPYQATVARRMSADGCPRCEGRRWTAAQIVAYIKHLDLLAPDMEAATRILILVAAGAIKEGARDALTAATEAMVGDALPASVMEEILEGDAEEGMKAAAETIAESHGGHVVTDPETGEVTIEGGTDPEEVEGDDELGEATETGLPGSVETAGAALTRLGSLAEAFHDDEALLEYLISRAVARLWDYSYVKDSTEAVRDEWGGKTWRTKYQEEAWRRWADEARKVDDFALPAGYSFTDEEGEPALPNVMQRHLVVRLRAKQFMLNLSGTGTGKTLAAALASRDLDSPVTLVICPADTIRGWTRTFENAFPTVEIAQSTLEPAWRKHGRPKVLIVNIDKFSTDNPEVLRELVRQHEFGLIVVDEGHQAKQRGKLVSRRSENVRNVILGEFEENPRMHVLVQTATPVLNNLREGYSILELALLRSYEDANVKPTAANAAALYGQFVLNGIRSRRKPEKNLHDPLAEAVANDRTDPSFYGTGFVVADYASTLPALEALRGKRVSPLDLEWAVLPVKAPAFAEATIKSLSEDRTTDPASGVVGYAHFVGNDAEKGEAVLAGEYRDAILALDPTLRVELYTGMHTSDERKTILDRYIAGDADVLVASAPIGTGVDGLQLRTRTLVMATLPPTSAQYEQIVGRIHRQGQKYDTRVVIVRGELTDPSDGSCYSPENRSLRRVARKRTLADAAVDGIYPDGGFVKDGEAAKASLDWLDRLETAAFDTEFWESAVLDADFWDAIKSHLPGAGKPSVQTVLSRMNARWNREASSKREARFLEEGAGEWEAYHKAYAAARAEWGVLPVDLAAAFVTAFASSDDTVLDLGAGEALLADRLPTHENLRSFDHIAADPRVEVADITALPVGEKTARFAVLCLAIMGSNDHAYLREAARVVHPGGWLWLAEPTKRFHGDLDGFGELMENLGFVVVSTEERGQFTVVQAARSAQEPAMVLPEWHFGHEGAES